MKAAVFRGAGQKLEICDVPMPETGAGQIKLKVKHCGICGSDLHMTDPSAAHNPAPGAVIGHEFCGEIVEIGAKCDPRWKEGARVTALPFSGCGACAACLSGEPVWCKQMISHAGGRIQGGYAEYVVVGARETVAMPSALSWREGALIEPLAVGLHGYNLANLEPGSDILVLGAGPIGLAVVACARAAGARHIIVTAKSSQRAELARTMGATDFIESGPELRKNFAKIAGGPPAAVFECVGAPGMIDLCMSVAPPRSTVVVMGACMQPDTFRPTLGLNKELRVQYSMAYNVHDFEVAADLIARERVAIEPMVTDVVDFAAFPDAFEALRARTTQCKVLLTPN
ncbi:MAG: alcohol dehydrogenase catalytic domain-containing protein [Hyphomonadaceae bacterium]